MAYWIQKRRHGTPITLDFFLDRSSPEPNSGCWIWLNAISWNGYGAVNRGDGKGITRAHRLCYEIANGVTLPESIDVCHSCDIRCCVNPDHLFAGSRTDNMRDCANKGRSITPDLRGEDCPAAKLTENNVLAIRSSGLSLRAIARIYGVNKGTIGLIVHRKTWRHI